MSNNIDRFEVISADGSRKRWIYVVDNSHLTVKTMSGSASVNPSYWFEDTRRIAASKDGQSFFDPTDDTRYTKV